MQVDYKSAGVNIQAGNETVSRIKPSVESTFSPSVLTGIGSFGSLFDLTQVLKQYSHPVLVQSMDGVGTKMMIAHLMNRYDTIGIDLVSATTNDIIVLGAVPLTLLDYIANARLNPDIIVQMVAGMARACQEHGIALVGGEMAEMPGIYMPNQHDLVGIVTGLVDKNKILLGQDIKPGDEVCGFASSGLHTNGFSLARKLFFEVGGYSVESFLPSLNNYLGEILLVPHINYAKPIRYLLEKHIPIKGMAHITGGGLLENIPRVLPSFCNVTIDTTTWPEMPIFSCLRQLGNLKTEEMYRTFNMGIGMVFIGPAGMFEEVKGYLSFMPEFTVYKIGKVTEGNKRVVLCK